MGLDTQDASKGDGWASWTQNILGNVITSATAAKYQQPYALQQAQIEAQARYGNFGAGFNLSPMLLIGGVVLLGVFLIKD